MTSTATLTTYARSTSRVLTVAVLAFSTVAAIPASASSGVHPSHPRLLMRRTMGESSDSLLVTLEDVRRKAADPRFERFRRRLTRSMPNLAIRALVYGDSAAADSALTQLLAPTEFTGTTWDGIRVYWKALVFDWLYDHPAFDEAEKRAAVERIARDAAVLQQRLVGGGHIFHTRMTAWAAGLTAAGYALHGHHPSADTLIAFAVPYVRNELFRARHRQGGSVHNGFGYGRHYTMWLIGHTISVIYTATGLNLWDEIRSKQDDWAAREAEFIMYGRQPDGPMAKYADAYHRTTSRFSFRVIAERNWFYRNRTYQDALEDLLADNDVVFEIGNDYIAYLYYDPDRPATPEGALPNHALFGPEGTGMVFWRSGWDRDALWLFFKAGDYFGDHGHFDQGHVEIIRRAPILAESGAYAGGFDGEFRMDYYRRTISHNTILIVDPDTPGDMGGQRIHKNQWSGSLEEYLADPGNETGNIIAYAISPRIAYLKADLTPAYPPERARRVTRELALVDDRFLVVRDSVVVTARRYVPKILWHAPVHPDIVEAARFRLKRDGSSIAGVSLTDDTRYKWVAGLQAGGRTFTPEFREHHVDTGVGRLELSNGPGRLEHGFLQVLDISGQEAEEKIEVWRKGRDVGIAIGDSIRIRWTSEGPRLVETSWE